MAKVKILKRMTVRGSCKGLKDERHAKQKRSHERELERELERNETGAYGCSESLQKLSMNDLKI